MSPAVRQFIVILFSALGVFLLVRALNHHLSVWQVQLTIGGLLITPSALRLQPKAALAAAFVTGLGLDVTMPVPFGENAILLMAATTLVLGLRHRIPREELAVSIAVAIILNLLLVLARTFLHLTDWPDPASNWLSLFASLVASQLFIGLIAPWFFALQRHSLVWIGADYATVNPSKY